MTDDEYNKRFLYMKIFIIALELMGFISLMILLISIFFYENYNHEPCKEEYTMEEYYWQYYGGKYVDDSLNK